MKIYPNPATKSLQIQSSVTVRAVITDIEGKKLMDVANAKDIDISGLSNGLYLITLYNDAGEKVSIQKLTKE